MIVISLVKIKANFLFIIFGFASVLNLTAQVVDRPTPTATANGFRGFQDSTTFFKTLTRQTSYVGNNPGPTLIYNWDPTTKQTTLTVVPAGAAYDTTVCQGNIAILSDTEEEIYGTCCGVCTPNGDADFLTLSNPVGVNISIVNSTYVPREDPTNTAIFSLASTTALYSGEGIGDLVTFNAVIADSTQAANVQSYTWKATGPATITGPSGATASQWIINSPGLGTNWLPGTYTITVNVTLNDGETGKATYTQIIGVRALDVVAVGWIDPKGVPLSSAGVDSDILSFFPPEGYDKEDNSQILLKIAAGAYLGVIASTEAPASPFTPERDALTPADRRYIFDWQFKYAANPTPPTTFSSEADLDAFVANHENYKLYNRLQIEFTQANNAFASSSPIIIHQGTIVGTTSDPFFGFAVQGQAVGSSGQIGIIGGNTSYQIVEGLPEAVATSSLDALAYPKMFNPIGVTIEEGVTTDFNYKILNQIYPTYNIYERQSDGSFVLKNMIPEAPDPFDTCTLIDSLPFLPPTQ